MKIKGTIRQGVSTGALLPLFLLIFPDGLVNVRVFRTAGLGGDVFVRDNIKYTLGGGRLVYEKSFKPDNC
jgi:hypothetical protein